MSTLEFPDPHATWVDGLVAVGGRADVGTLYHAYSRGIFPWPQEGMPMLWFSPEERGVLVFDELHVPKRLQRDLERDEGLRYSRDEAFAAVIAACRDQKRPGQQGTWILPGMIEAYLNFHRAGFVRSFEVWRGAELVGGLYGVLVEGVFSGESMFHRETDASKKALVYAVSELQAEGLDWMDTQMVTPVVQSLGGRTIPREEYLRWMKKSQLAWNRPGRR
ncbi:MAG: leucyl/phenylalanyl-tRNA--protein transferase [Bdellovibrionaceae bacterium]|nr:leucyl/phenylalanyl-tRNA--protein transferase [Pseudobdellovibrionaceae bacterium]